MYHRLDGLHEQHCVWIRSDHISLEDMHVRQVSTQKTLIATITCMLVDMVPMYGQAEVHTYWIVHCLALATLILVARKNASVH